MSSGVERRVSGFVELGAGKTMLDGARKLDDGNVAIN
jgi:hypothetical protein